MKKLILMVAATLVTGCQNIKPTSDEMVRLNSSEIRELFSGKTVESVSKSNGITSFTYYEPNGTVFQERFWENRAGKWRVTTNDEVCLTMEGGEESCRVILMDPGSFFNGYDKRYYKYRVKSSGSLKMVVRYRQFIEGNVVDTYR